MSGRRVIELGAGTGYVAMSVHLLGSRVCVATDRGDVLGVLKNNLLDNAILLEEANGAGILDLAHLDWEEVQHEGTLPEALQPSAANGGPFELVLACDCLFQRQHAEALLAVLERLASQHHTNPAPAEALGPSHGNGVSERDDAAASESASPHPAMTVLVCQSFRGAPDVEAAFLEAASRSFAVAEVSQDATCSPDHNSLRALNIVIWRLRRSCLAVPG